MAEELPSGISEQDLDAAFSGPAILINRFIVTLHPSGARLSFWERRAPDSPPEFRASVLLSYQDAIELSKLLTRMLQPIEAAIGSADGKAKVTGASNG
jgi:hypothetical protein